MLLCTSEVQELLLDSTFKSYDIYMTFSVQVAICEPDVDTCELYSKAWKSAFL